MKNVNIMLGGPVENIPELTAAATKQPWVGADHGNIVLLERHITPQISVGDFDSLTSIERNLLEAQVGDIRYSNPVKDYTDSQLAVKVALQDLQAQKVTIYGASGGRLDQEMINLLLPLDFYPQFKFEQFNIVDRNNVISYYGSGSYTIDKLPQMKYLAFVNLVPVTNLTIKNARYDLEPTDFNRPVSLSSNEFVGNNKVSFSFDNGVLAVMQSMD